MDYDFKPEERPRRRAASGLLLVLAVLVGWLSLADGPARAMVTTTASAAIFTYDAQTVARVDVHAFGAADASPARLSVAKEGSASPPVEAQGRSTTLLSRRVATEAASGQLRPAVIGEGMGARVKPFAAEHDYVTYPGMENWQNYSADELLAHNRAQIETWIGEGRPIIDVGPAPGRPFFPMETSEAYGMEHNIVRGYPGYQPVVLDGETSWLEMLVGHGS